MNKMQIKITHRDTAGSSAPYTYIFYTYLSVFG